MGNWLAAIVERFLSSRSSTADLPYFAFTNAFDQVLDWTDLDGKYEQDPRFFESDFKEQLDRFDQVSKKPISSPLFPISVEQSDELAVSILVDHSGSMVGEKSLIARHLTELLDGAFLASGIEHEVLGFTTSSWLGGNSACRWIADGAPRQCGRVCDLLHIIYRSLGDRSPTGDRFSSILDARLLKENIDGEAIEWAAERLGNSARQRKRIIVVSDGAPVDDRTLTANDDGILVRHLHEVVTRVRETAGWDIGGIGIQYATQGYYSPSIELRNLEFDLSTLAGFLAVLIDHKES